MHIEARVPDFDQAVAVTSLGFAQPRSEALEDDVRCHLEGDIVLTLTVENRVQGYAVFRVDGNLLYLAGAMINPELQGRGIAGRFVVQAQEVAGATFLGLRTQSPVMWASGRKLCQKWHPLPAAGADEDPQLAAVVSRAVAISGSRAQLDAGCYGGPLYGVKPVHADHAVQRWWDSICDFNSGDAVVCVGRF